MAMAMARTRLAAASRARGRAWGRARNLLLDLMADHAAAGHPLCARHAHADRAACLVRHPLLDADCFTHGLALGHALVDRAHVLLLTRHGLAGVHLAGDRAPLADALHDRAGVLFPGRARHPALDRLGPRRTFLRARLAAIIPVTELVELVQAARAARHLLALVVPLVHALADALGFRNALPHGLVCGALLNARHLLADGAAFLHLAGNVMVHNTGAR